MASFRETPPVAIRRWLREPLVAFLLLSAAVFAFYAVAGADAGRKRGRIVITAAQIEGLKAGFVRTWMRPPTREELQGLVEDRVRTEVLAREAVAMGLDRDDSVIRRHLRTKIESLADDLARRPPTEADLQDYLARNPDAFRQEPRFTFRQVYLNPDRHRDSLDSEAARLLARLDALGPGASIEGLGDGALLAPAYQGASRREVANTFGAEFAERLSKLDTGRWQGPIPSGYGLHVVIVDEREEGRLPALAEIRSAVEREWSSAQLREAKEELYAQLRGRYTVSVELGR